MKIEPLPWDTGFFGVSAGRLSLKSGFDLKRVRNTLADCAYEVITLVLTSYTDQEIEAVQEFADLTGYKHEYATPTNGSLPVGPSIQEYDGHLTDELLNLALLSGHKSRFRQDSRFSPHFPDLYREWIEGSIEGRLADVVLVYMQGETIAGFVTVSKGDPCRIGLFAVEPAFHGQGIGSQLLGAASRWSAQQGAARLHVATQRENPAACHVYEKNGYTLASEHAIFHYWAGKKHSNPPSTI